LTPCADTQFQGSLGAQDTRGWKNVAIFRKSQGADRYLSVPMTLSDPNPGFKSLHTYKSNIFKKPYYITLTGAHA